MKLVLTVLTALAAALVAGAAAFAEDTPDPKDLSAGFWSGWRAQQPTADVAKLKLEAAQSLAKARPSGPTQVEYVADLAITDPAIAARIMNTGAAATNSPEARAALQTVLRLRASKAVQAAAIAQAPKSERAQLAQFSANLSNGISGLPGVYLSGQTAPQRAATPAGFQPVAGSSLGCPAH